MDIIIAIFFGAVQGATEFIPISSSGHLLLLHSIFPEFTFVDQLAFDVALHIGTLIALVAVFWKDCFKYIKAIFIKPASALERDDKRLAWLIVLSVIPAGVVGLLFEDYIESTLRSPLIVAVMLIMVAILFLIIESKKSRSFINNLEAMRWKQALFIGCMQALALIPGTSRSGITIIGGMITKLKREQAARFSFLISMPVIFGAGLKKTYDIFIIGIHSSDVPTLALGLLTAAVVGYCAINFLLKFLTKNTLRPFAIYRIILAGIILIIVSINSLII